MIHAVVQQVTAAELAQHCLAHTEL
jgi:hypothetical protein